MDARTRILLAEDHNTVREGIKMLVNAQPDMEVVGEAADGRAAITRGAPAVARPPGHGYIDAGVEWAEGDRETARGVS